MPIGLPQRADPSSHGAAGRLYHGWGGGTIWTGIAYRGGPGARLPHRVDTEVQAEGPVRGDEKGGRRDPEGAAGAHGRGRHARGHRVPGPHPHVPEGSAQARRERRRREAIGQERDHPARGAPRAEEGDGQGPHAAGEGLLREHGRPERVRYQEVHPAAGGGKPHRVGEEPPIGDATRRPPARRGLAAMVSNPYGAIRYLSRGNAAFRLQSCIESLVDRRAPRFRWRDYDFPVHTDRKTEYEGNQKDRLRRPHDYPGHAR